MALENAETGTPRNPAGPRRDDFADFPRDQYKRPKIIRAVLNEDTGVWEVPVDVEGKPIKELVPFTRASTLGGAIEYQGGLHRWKTAVALWGAFKSRTLGKRVRALSGYSKRSDKDELYEIIDKATTLAEADEKADHGTALHSVFQRIAEGETVDQLISSGAIDPDDEPACRAFADAITRFEVLFCERRVVCDEAQAAGKYDIIVTPRRPMPVTDKGGVVIGVILPGDLVAVDNKTSATADYFGEKFCVQLWIYAHGRAYDRETGERTEVGCRKDFALIMHIPSGTGVDDDGVIDPEGGSATWHWVDLRIGGELVKTARAVLEGRRIGKRAIIKADLDAEIPADVLAAEISSRDIVLAPESAGTIEIPAGTIEISPRPSMLVAGASAGAWSSEPDERPWDPTALAAEHARGRFPDRCELCNYDRHVCPGCGDDTPHDRDGLASPCAACSIESAACPQHGAHGGTVDCPECLELWKRAVGPLAGRDPNEVIAGNEPGDTELINVLEQIEGGYLGELRAGWLARQGIRPDGTYGPDADGHDPADPRCCDQFHPAGTTCPDPYLAEAKRVVLENPGKTVGELNAELGPPPAAPAPQPLGPDLQRAAVRNALLTRLRQADTVAELVDLRSRASGAGYWEAEHEDVLSARLSALVSGAPDMATLGDAYRAAAGAQLWSDALNVVAGNRKAELTSVSV